MKFQEKYTTAKLISADKTGEEVNKVELTDADYSKGEMLQAVVDKIDALRVRLNG